MGAGARPAAVTAAEDWDTLDARYGKALARLAASAKSKCALPEVEGKAWAVGAAAAEREPPALGGTEDLVAVVRWKLTRGKVRPNLLKWAGEHKDAAVVAASREAVARLAKGELVSKAMEPLTALKGIGPATAAYVLGVIDPSVPVMSDEALTSTGSKQRDYTPQRLDELVADVRTLAAAAKVTARAVEQALFTRAHGCGAAGAGAEAEAPSAKRRRR